MKDINRVELRGRVGNIQFFGRENNVASISVSTRESYQDRKTGEWTDVTTWHRVKAFTSNKALPPLDTIEKGMIISVIGSLSTNKYTDRDGNDRENTEITASDIAIIRDAKAAQKPQGAGRAANYDDDF